MPLISNFNNSPDSSIFDISESDSSSQRNAARNVTTGYSTNQDAAQNGLNRMGRGTQTRLERVFSASRFQTLIEVTEEHFTSEPSSPGYLGASFSGIHAELKESELLERVNSEWTAWANARPRTLFYAEDRKDILEKIQSFTQPEQTGRTTRSRGISMVSRNLSSVPDIFPPNISTINLSKNKLTSFPDGLPDSVTHLFLEDNDISVWPKAFPSKLEKIILYNNKMNDVPDEVLLMLPRHCQIELGKNKIPEHRQAEIMASAADIFQIKIRFFDPKKIDKK